MSKPSECPYKKATEAGVFNKPEINSSPTNGFPGQKCPFMGNRVNGVEGTGPQLEAWFPKRLRVELLGLPSRTSNPYGDDYDYAKEFSTINYKELKEDLTKWMTDSQSWWPADYGHYGPQTVRATWHGAGTYRIADGRGGAGHGYQRFLPISSWADNGNIDKTRRLLWPIKQKYGDKLSWADLLVLAGTVALESMGVKTLGFAGGRTDAWENDIGTFWGNETTTFGRDDRWGKNDNFDGKGDFASPLGATEAELIYVNPEGPGTNPDPIGSAREIRNAFRRMALTDEEIVALIAGGHTFGKSHGAVAPDNVGPVPGNSSIENQGLGWINKAGTGNAEYTITNGCEGSWTGNPIHFDKDYLINLLDYDWKLAKSPAGNWQWHPTEDLEKLKTPDAHLSGVDHPVMMFTSDIALKNDPEFAKVLKKFRDSPPEVFRDAFAYAWFKLTHRDLGPKSRYVGPEIPEEDYPWQDPIPPFKHKVVDESDIARLKGEIRKSSSDLLPYARAAWASASTFRSSDKRGGVNGARIRLAPQKDWEVNRPEELKKTLASLEGLQKDFNSAQSGSGKQISLADLIVLAGTVAIEEAAKKGGVDVKVPFTPGRSDTTAELTDTTSFEWLHPVMDGFRNFESEGLTIPAENFLLDRAQLLDLSAPQLAVLIGGARALNFNWDGSDLGILTTRPGALTNDFFVNLTDTATEWKPLDEQKTRFEGVDRESGKHKWYATRTDLIFGYDEQLRALSEVYGSSSGHKRLVADFVKAWDHVMTLDRFDLHR